MRHLWVAALSLLLTVVATAPSAWAHGVGGRVDLPVPAWQLAWAASFAVAASFVALGMLWDVPRLQAASKGRALPRALQQIMRALSLAARPVGVFALVVLLIAGLFGNTNPAVNIAPVAVYILFWVALQVVSVVIGDVWRALSPFETIAASAVWLRTRASGQRLSSVQQSHGNQWWAVAAIFAFVWLELAYHDNANPRVLGVFLTAYTIAILTGAAVFGAGWVRDAEGFGVLFTKLAAMAPLYRDDQGAWRVRSPLAGLAVLPTKPGAVAFVLVVLGSTTFDGLGRSSFWLDVAANRTGWQLTAINTVGLVFVILCVYVLYRTAIAAMAAIVGESERSLSELFVASLIPIAAAYTIAHYFSYVLLEGQLMFAHISDPFGQGWDIFGTATRRVNYTWISPDVIAWIQTAAIAIGHVLGVLVAHDIAVQRWSRRLAIRSQYPMLAVMIIYTVVGLMLLLGV